MLGFRIRKKKVVDADSAMSSSPMRRSSNSKPARLSPFYRDLASPVSLHRPTGRYSTIGYASSASTPWPETLSTSSSAAAAADHLPPPPIFTLDDRSDISPEAALRELPLPSPASLTSATNHTPPFQLDQREPHSPSPSLLSSSFVVRTRAEAYGSGVDSGRRRSPERQLWMLPQVDSGGRDIDRGSPVDGVVQPGALITLPSPSTEVAKVQLRGQCKQNAGLDGDLWVTVFGFYPHDANLVLHEFEKCGTIIKHLPGPPGANWIHIQYANPYDAQKALRKNGIQPNNFLIVGVKSVMEPLTEATKKLSNGGFIPLRPGALSSSVTLNQSRFLARPNLSKPSSTSIAGDGQHGNVSLATPSNSVVSKIMDLMLWM